MQTVSVSTGTTSNLRKLECFLRSSNEKSSGINGGTNLFKHFKPLSASVKCPLSLAWYQVSQKPMKIYKLLTEIRGSIVYILSQCWAPSHCHSVSILSIFYGSLFYCIVYNLSIYTLLGCCEKCDKIGTLSFWFVKFHPSFHSLWK